MFKPLYILRTTLQSLIIFIFTMCNSSSPLFQVSNDRIVQESSIALVNDDLNMSSTYKSLSDQNFPNLLEIRFGINGRDNELISGFNHTLLLDPKVKEASHTFTFGENSALDRKRPKADAFLTDTIKLTINLDATKVLNTIKSKGFFITVTGEKIFKEDFNNIVIAGSLAPLTFDWDFLYAAPHFRLKKNPTKLGFYFIEITIPPKPHIKYITQWVCNRDLSRYPSLKSSSPILKACYNLLLNETSLSKEQIDSTFSTGIEWPGVWTRDISYSILNSFALIDPRISQITLLKKVSSNGIIIQDTGTGGSWPISTDKLIWVIAAFEVYKSTGDLNWLNTIYPIIKNSIEKDLLALYGKENLPYGEQSFLDWRRQSYPLWVSASDIFQTNALNTAIIHAKAISILQHISKELITTSNNLSPDKISQLKEDCSKYSTISNNIKKSINSSFGFDQMGYLGAFIYGDIYKEVSSKYETLGNSLAVLWDIVSTDKALSIVKSAPTTYLGVPVFHPQTSEVFSYHNNSIWPFVHSFYVQAASKTRNLSAVEYGLNTALRPIALFLTNKENFIPETGCFYGTQVNSDRMLWSIAGNLALYYRVLFGITLSIDKIHFNPMVPENFKDLTLKNFSYRNKKLTLNIHGYGNRLKSLSLNGIKMNGDSFSHLQLSDTTNIVDMYMTNESSLNSEVEIKENLFSLATPILTKEDGKLSWSSIKNATSYTLVFSSSKGKIENTISSDTTSFSLGEIVNLTEVKVRANSTVTQLNSFFSNSIILDNSKNKSIRIIEAENTLFTPYTSLTNLPLGYNSTGYVYSTPSLNNSLTYNFKSNYEGIAYISVRYLNPFGPYNTLDKCGVRSVYINEKYQGIFAMGHQSENEYSYWLQSNILPINVIKGNNIIHILYEEFNANTNQQGINDIYLDNLIIYLP